MSKVMPFAALRPPKDLAAVVAAPPYDVVNTQEARALAAETPTVFSTCHARRLVSRRYG